jgi:hypothetical protein
MDRAPATKLCVYLESQMGRYLWVRSLSVCLGSCMIGSGQQKGGDERQNQPVSRDRVLDFKWLKEVQQRPT